jgi:hypothetical protein
MNSDNRSRSLSVALLIATSTLAPLAVGCSADASSSPDAGDSAASSAKTASDAFWNTYWANDYAGIPAVQSALQAALNENPRDANLTALLAATHWWHVSEAAAREKHPDPTVLNGDLPTALQLMNQAAQLDPDEDHYPGFIGVLLVHIGRRTNDQNLVTQGDEMLANAVYRFPEFNGFNTWAAHNADPKDSPDYLKALDALWNAVDECIGTKIDRTNPDVTPYMHLETSHGRKKVCWDENGLALHAFEGLMLNLGNGLVKAGDVAAARVVFHNAQLGSGYSTWPYRSILESLAASDLEARAALYADGDPTNDPPPSGIDRSCVYCHAKVPEP